MKNAFHIMLIPTLGCPSKCSYCWSSEEGSPVMSIETVQEVVNWLKNLHEERVTFTFHGGEPLLAGADFYRNALPLLSNGLKHLNPEFAMQTNLWKMTPEIARVLAEYHVPIGSSIDGPEEINDSQRGGRILPEDYERVRHCEGTWPYGQVHLHIHLRIGEIPGGNR